MKKEMWKVLIIVLVGIVLISGMIITKKSFDKSENEKVAVGRFVDLETGDTLAITFMDDDGTVYMIEGDTDELNATWTSLKN